MTHTIQATTWALAPAAAQPWTDGPEYLRPEDYPYHPGGDGVLVIAGEPNAPKIGSILTVGAHYGYHVADPRRCYTIEVTGVPERRTVMETQLADEDDRCCYPRAPEAHDGLVVGHSPVTYTTVPVRVHRVIKA